MREARHRRPAIPYRLVLVEWEDSARPISSWEWVENYELPKIVKCISVGYLIADSKRAIALAPNLGDIEQDQIQASGILRVPRSAVRLIRDLES